MIGIEAGAVTGVMVLVPVLILQLARGIGVVPEMQLAASSLIGMAAYDGALSLLTGALLHFPGSVGYALAADRLPAVNRSAWIAGPALGLGVFLVMGLVLLPHTAFVTPPGVSPMPFVPAALIHIFGFGLPIALLVRRKNAIT